MRKKRLKEGTIRMKKNFSKKIIVSSAIMLTAASLNAAGAPESIPGEYVVKLKSNMITTFNKTSLSTKLNSYVKSTIPGQNIVVVKKASFENVDSAIKSLNQNSMVEYAEPNYIYRINKVPNDLMYGQLWGMQNLGQKDPKGQVGVAGIDINAEKAWDIQTGTKEKIVAIIDTGIDYRHPDLADNMWTNDVELNGKPGVDDDNNGVVDDIYGYNANNDSGDPMDDQGHGSHCAGTIGAKGDDGRGVVGVNWNVRMMAVKFLDASGSGSLEGAIKAIDYATKMGAHVMSNSWGGGGFTQSLFDSIKRSNEAGAIFIAAAGNDDSNNDSMPSYPASYDVENIISVAAIDNKGSRASFSNYGRKSVHIGAPGVNILSTTGGKYESFSGTSMATPHVSGVAALVWANEPGLTAKELKHRLLATAKPIAGLKGKTKTGAMVDAYAALTNTTPPPDMNDPINWAASIPLSVQSASPYKSNTNQTFEISVPGAKEFAIYFDKFDTEASYDTVTIYDEKGTKIQVLSGKNDDSFSSVITGSSARIVFKSDASVEKTGWSISKAAYR